MDALNNMKLKPAANWHQAINCYVHTSVYDAKLQLSFHWKNSLSKHILI